MTGQIEPAKNYEACGCNDGYIPIVKERWTGLKLTLSSLKQTEKQVKKKKN